MSRTIIEWDDDKTSKTWGKILKHKFFTAFNKDIYIKDLLTEIANTIYLMELKIERCNNSEDSTITLCGEDEHG